LANGQSTRVGGKSIGGRDAVAIRLDSSSGEFHPAVHKYAVSGEQTRKTIATTLLGEVGIGRSDSRIMRICAEIQPSPIGYHPNEGWLRRDLLTVQGDVRLTTCGRRTLDPLKMWPNSGESYE